MAIGFQGLNLAQGQKKKKEQPEQRATSAGTSIVRTPVVQLSGKAPKSLFPKTKAPSAVVTQPAGTLRGAVGQAYNAGRGLDEQTQTALWDALATEVETPGSAYYNAYFKPTSKAAQELTALGIQLPDEIDDAFLRDAGAFIAMNQRNTATGTTAAAPTKSSTAEQNTAYWLSRYIEDYDTTQAAKNESLALDRELSYWVGRGYSDDAAIAKLDMKQYPTLSRMREAQGIGEPLQLTEALPYSDDWLYTKAWAARNGDIATGDYMTDLMLMGMGQGVGYKPDPLSDAARDPSNAETYNPYMFGATSDSMRMKYGVDSWDANWLEQNRAMLNDEATADDWRKMYDAEQNTQKAKAELADLEAHVTRLLGIEDYTADKILARLDLDSEYPTLAKMEHYRVRGTSLELSDSVDFSMPYFEQWVRDKAASAEKAPAQEPESETIAETIAEEPPKKEPKAAKADLEAEMHLLSRIGMPIEPDSITPEAANAINEGLSVALSNEEIAARINARFEDGGDLTIKSIFQDVQPGNIIPEGADMQSATTAFTAEDTMRDLEALKGRALNGIGVNMDKLPASVKGVVDKQFADALTEAIAQGDDFGIKRLFDDAVQGVKDAESAPSAGAVRAEDAAPQPVKAATLVSDLEAIKRRALSGQAIPIGALSETLLGAMQAATGFDADALNAEMQNAVETGDVATLIGWIDQTTAMLSEQVAELDPPEEQGIKRGNVDLDNRPQVPDSALVDAGWMDPGEANGSYATIYSTFFTAGDRKKDDGFREAFGMQKDYQADKEMIIHITPILSDGHVLTRQEVEDYVGAAIDSGDILEYDAKHNNIALAVDDVSKSFNWQEAWQSAEEYDEALHVQQEELYSQKPEELEAPPKAPVEPWDWDSYRTKPTTMSATDFQRYNVDLEDGVLEYLRTGETTNEAARSFVAAYEDLFDGDRWGFDRQGREIIADRREKYGQAIVDAMDSVNRSFVDGNDYVRAVIDLAGAFEDAQRAEPFPETVDAMDANEHQRTVVEQNPMLFMGVYDEAMDYYSDVELSAIQADAYFAANPGALDGILSVASKSQADAQADAEARAAERKAAQEAAIQEREEQIAEYIPFAVGALDAEATGAATDEQAELVTAIRGVISDSLRGGDDVYARYNAEVFRLASGGYDWSNATTETSDQMAQREIGFAIRTRAMQQIDDHLGMASLMGLSLKELYERYPDMYIEPEQLVEAAQSEYNDVWNGLGSGADALLEAATVMRDDSWEQEDRNIAALASKSTPKSGLASGWVFDAIEAGWWKFGISHRETYDVLTRLGASPEDQRFNMMARFDTRAEAATGSAAAVSGIQDEELKKELTADLTGRMDAFDFPYTPEDIANIDAIRTTQKNIDAAYQTVADNATPAEAFAFNAISGTTDSALRVAELMIANTITGGQAPLLMSSLVFGAPEGAEFAKEIYDATSSREAAMWSGTMVAFVNGYMNSERLKSFNLPGIGTGEKSGLQEMIGAGFSKLAIEKPGAAASVANTLLYTVGRGASTYVGEGWEEVEELAATETAKSIILYLNTGIWTPPDLSSAPSEFFYGGITGVFLEGVSTGVNSATNIVTGKSRLGNIDGAAIVAKALEATAANNVAVEIAQGGLDSVLNGPEAANAKGAETELANARVILADTEATIAEQSRLQEDAEATFLNNVTEENLAVWDSATEALEAAQGKLDAVKNDVDTKARAVENAKADLNAAVEAQMNAIRANAEQAAKDSLANGRVIRAAQAAAKGNLDKARFKLETLKPGSKEYAVVAAQIRAMETSSAVADFEAANGSLLTVRGRRGDAARSAHEALQSEQKSAADNLNRLTNPVMAAKGALDAELKAFSEGTHPNEMIAMQGVKNAQLGVKLAEAENAYAQTQAALRGATADADVDALITADDAAKAALADARAMFDGGKAAMQSVIRDTAIDTLAKSDNETAKELGDAIASNDRAKVEQIISDVVDAQPITAEPANIAQMANELMSGGDNATEIAFRIATKGKSAPSQDIDAEYMTAANNGDTETAQMMVDEAAKAAGYLPFKVWHGSRNAGHTVFGLDFSGVSGGQNLGIGVYFSEDPVHAARFAGKLFSDPTQDADGRMGPWHTYGNGSGVITVYPTKESILDLGMNPKDRADLRAAIQNRLGVNPDDPQAITDAAKALGYAGIAAMEANAYQVVIFDTNKFKSAEPITYDDNGKIIPLSQRFNLESNDIRFRKGGSGVAATVPKGSTVNPGTPSGRIRNPVQIARSLLRGIGTGDYVGKSNAAAGAGVTIPKGMLGYYESRANYVFTNRDEAGNFATTMHEAGHALAAKLGMTGTQDMVDQLPASFAQNYAASALPGEAFAEFAYRYMTEGRDAAVAFAGADFVNDFEAKMRDAKVYDTVAEHAAAVREFLSASTDAQVRAVVVNTPSKRNKEGFWTRTLSKMFDATRAATDLDNAIGKVKGLTIREELNYRTFRERMAAGNMDKVATDAHGNIVGKSLAQTMEDAGLRGEHFDALTNYMVAKHALDLMNRDEPIHVLPENITRADLEAVVADVESNNKIVADGAKIINGWWNAFMQRWLVDTGLLAQQEFDAMKAKNPNYVPLLRAHEVSGNGPGKGSAYKLTYIKSGTVEIANPFNAYSDLMQQMGRLVAQNEVARAVHEAYRNNPDLGVFLRDVTPKQSATTETDADAGAAVKRINEGLKRPSVDENSRVIKGVDENGKKFAYEIAEGQNELMTALAGSPKAAKGVLEGAARITRTVSMLITGKNPLFAIRNAIRDFQTSVNYGSWAVTSLDGAVKWIGAMIDVLGKKDGYKEYMAMGGGGYSFRTSGTTKSNAEYRADMFKGNTDDSPSGTARYAGRKIVKWMTLESMNEAIEQTSRYAEYKYGKHDRSTIEGRQKALLAAQDVTVDFTRAGNAPAYRMLKAVIPFLGPSMQGVYRTMRMFAPEERGRLAPRLAKTILNYGIRAATQYALLALFADDDDWDEYERLQDMYKAKYFYIPVKRFGGDNDDSGGLIAIKLPTSEDIVNRTAYTLALWGIGKGTDKVSMDLLGAMTDMLADPLPDSSIYSPIQNVKQNKTWTGATLVPRSLETRAAIDQYEDDTAAAFVGMSKLLYNVTGGATAISPMKLQYLAQQYTGVIGQIALPLMGTVGNADAPLLARPFIDVAKQFYTDTTYSNTYGNAFYTYRDGLTGIVKAGDTSGVAEDINPHLTDAERKQAYLDAKAMNSASGVFGTAAKNVADLYAQIDENNRNESLSFYQRSDLNRSLREQINHEFAVANAEAEIFYGKYGVDRGLVGNFQRIAGGGADAQRITAPTKIETLPDIFQADAQRGAAYIGRSEELIEAHPTMTSIYPNPSRTIEADGIEYTVGDKDWNEYTQEYYDAYIYEIENMTDAEWESLDDEARVDFYKNAHSEASRSAKKLYLKYLS